MATFIQLHTVNTTYNPTEATEAIRVNMDLIVSVHPSNDNIGCVLYEANEGDRYDVKETVNEVMTMLNQVLVVQTNW